MSDRDALISTFLADCGWGAAARRILADDASFRRYDRLTGPDRSAVLMDAPPDKEDVRPFLAVAQILERLGLSAPEILAQRPEDGLLLLEDLGDDTYTSVLASAPDREEVLYMLAVDLLIALHRRFDTAPEIPPYDDALLMTEVDLLADWYFPAVTGKPLAEGPRRDYTALWRSLFEQAWTVPETLVLRDYHVDNMIWLPDRADVRACGLLDFQDAVIGPVTYDLVSLLEDARRDVPPGLTERALTRYLAAVPDTDPEMFRRSYAILGAQRSTKILGIFTRLDRRDGKPDYLHHIPRVWRWLESDFKHPALAGMRDWFAQNLPPQTRIVPEPATAS